MLARCECGYSKMLAAIKQMAMNPSKPAITLRSTCTRPSMRVTCMIAGTGLLAILFPDREIQKESRAIGNAALRRLATVRDPRGFRAIGPTDSYYTTEYTAEAVHRGGGLSHQTLCHNDTNGIQRTNRSPTLAEQKAMTGPRILFAASLVVTAVFAAITLSVLPREALVPVTITFIFLLGAVVALVASQTSVSTQQFTYWDAAGLLAAIGMIACAMVEPVELARLVDDDSRP